MRSRISKSEYGFFLGLGSLALAFALGYIGSHLAVPEKYPITWVFIIASILGSIVEMAYCLAKLTEQWPFKLKFKIKIFDGYMESDSEVIQEFESELALAQALGRFAAMQSAVRTFPLVNRYYEGKRLADPPSEGRYGPNTYFIITEVQSMEELERAETERGLLQM